MSDDYVLLTGVTGNIGRYLLRDLLLQGQSLAVLVRPRDDVCGRQRVEEIVSYWERELGQSLPSPVCLEGDTSHEFYGLNQKDRAWVRANCGTLLHNAASVAFGDTQGRTWDNNVSGAQRTLELCCNARIQHLAYVSTAYVCGSQTGIINEGSSWDHQKFRNEYEHSKFEAERILRDSKIPDQLTILRPGIVLGDHETGRTTTFHHFYRIAQFHSLFAQHASRKVRGIQQFDIRLNLTGEEIRNLVTVDWVSAAISVILLESRWHGRSYHLTPQRPTTSREVSEAINQFFQCQGMRFVGPMDLDDNQGSRDERFFYEYFAEYDEYWLGDPSFDRRNTDEATKCVPHPRVDVDCLIRLIDYAVRNRFGRRRKRVGLEVEQR
ncbi:MAG: nucleoside-diphosphate-sugar epimerase [Mariniblastus sp.]|jgi:nucleoside-diphosphate-sugar epimerase